MERKNDEGRFSETSEMGHGSYIDYRFLYATDTRLIFYLLRITRHIQCLEKPIIRLNIKRSTHTGTISRDNVSLTLFRNNLNPLLIS